jgi:RHS repeat-associated protein
VGGSYARTGLPAAVSSATYDAANRLVSWGANSSFNYDANGNLTGDGLNTYVWDARNQLASIFGGTMAGFQYDPLGRRISKTVGGITTDFLYDEANVAQELFGGIPSANLLTGRLDQVFARTDTSMRNFLSDRLGSTVALTDSSGAVATQYTYEPFGNTSSSGSSSSNSFQYTGRENDGTGLYFYRARYYDPQIGRFISEDPIGFLGGINIYAYVADDPLDFIDSFGLDKKKNCGLDLTLGAISVGFDIAGAIPGLGNIISAGAAGGRVAIGIEYAGEAYGIGTGLTDESPVGAVSAGTALGLTLADAALEGGKVIPVLGNALSLGTGVYDSIQLGKTIQRCW